ncbi:MAG: hypothetical protein E7311_06440 [Clostridiales bacterium]|nr:hypothetical protein [Clostridiales bacterium]
MVKEITNYKELKEKADSDWNIHRIAAAQSDIATEGILRKLSNDISWVVRLNVIKNSNLSDDLLVERFKEEKDAVVLKQIMDKLEERNLGHYLKVRFSGGKA